MLVLLSFLTMHAATFYVSTTGSDAAAGTIGAPWLTIRKGVIAMSGGDTLNIRGGTYSDDGFIIEEFRSGPTTNQPTTIQSHPGEWAVYYPSTNAVVGAYHGMILSAKSNIVLNSFEIDARNCLSDGIKLTDGTINVTITNVTVRGCTTGMGILATGVDEGDVMNSLITHCRLITNGWWSGPLDADLHQVYIKTSGMTVENCYFSGATNSRGTTYGIHYYGSYANNAIFRNNTMTNCGTGILAASTYGSNCWIYNNVIYKSQGYAIDLRLMSSVYLLNNTCVSNTAAIISTDSTNVWIENNIATRNGQGIAHYSNSVVTVRNNLSFDNNMIVGLGYGWDYRTTEAATTNANLFNVTDINGTLTTNSVSYDAEFVSADTGNFRLLSGSDARNTGLLQTIFNTDYDAISRPQESLWDMGAFELALEAPPSTPNLINVTTANVGTINIVQ